MTDRIKPLQGVLNFRDFGGYATMDGKQVTRGRLFRTASFAEASPQDIAFLDSLGARFVVDLRRPEERADAPNRWPGDKARVVTNDEGYVSMPAHMAILTETDLTADAVREYMVTAYSKYPFEPRYIELFRAFLHGLADEGGPAIVHCAAGKDRTGVICALTLTALGVDHPTIVGDYELTNAAVDYEKRMPTIKARMEERLGKEIDGVALLPMLGVHRDYLGAAFGAIGAKYPDVRSYMSDVLGVDEPMARELRARFVA